MVEADQVGETRRFRLSAFDVLVMVNLGFVLCGAAGAYQSKVDNLVLTTLVWVGVSVVLTACAGWLGKRHKTPPPPASENPARRVAAVLLLSIGGIVSLIGAVLALLMIGSLLGGTEDVPLPVIPLAFLPLLLGQSLMYGGARLRLEKAS